VSDGLDGLYTRRFGDRERAGKDRIWPAIVAHLERYMVEGPILDIACDRGYFIRHVSGHERWASDLRDMSADMTPDIRFVQASGLALTETLPAGHFGTAFMSNYLEHLPSAEAVLEQFRVIHGLLRPGGRVIVLQPNIRLVGGAYWDFIDHTVALTERSVEEAAGAAGFETRALVARFLPYTTKSGLPRHPLLVRGYLAFRPAWLVLGKQSLYVGERRA
jgi:SAM-dependent methyltransferase